MELAMVFLSMNLGAKLGAKPHLVHHFLAQEMLSTPLKIQVTN